MRRRKSPAKGTKDVAAAVSNMSKNDSSKRAHPALFMALLGIAPNRGGEGIDGKKLEAYRGTRDPGYINYTVGKLEILKLRDDYRAKTGDKFSLTDFHDRLLAGGLVPIKIIRREMMGEDGPVL